MRGGRGKKKKKPILLCLLDLGTVGTRRVDSMSALSPRRSQPAEMVPGVLITPATHICKHISSPGFYLTASFSPCSYGSPISLPDGDLEVWQVAGGIQPRWGKLKPNRGMKHLRSPRGSHGPQMSADSMCGFAIKRRMS